MLGGGRLGPGIGLAVVLNVFPASLWPQIPEDAVYMSLGFGKVSAIVASADRRIDSLTKLRHGIVGECWVFEEEKRECLRVSGPDDVPRSLTELGRFSAPYIAFSGLDNDGRVYEPFARAYLTGLVAVERVANGTDSLKVWFRATSASSKGECKYAWCNRLVVDRSAADGGIVIAKCEYHAGTEGYPMTSCFPVAVVWRERVLVKAVLGVQVRERYGTTSQMPLRVNEDRVWYLPESIEISVASSNEVDGRKYFAAVTERLRRGPFQFDARVSDAIGGEFFSSRRVSKVIPPWREDVYLSVEWQSYSRAQDSADGGLTGGTLVTRSVVWVSKQATSQATDWHRPDDGLMRRYVDSLLTGLKEAVVSVCLRGTWKDSRLLYCDVDPNTPPPHWYRDY